MAQTGSAKTRAKARSPKAKAAKDSRRTSKDKAKTSKEAKTAKDAKAAEAPKTSSETKTSEGGSPDPAWDSTYIYNLAASDLRALKTQDRQMLLATIITVMGPAIQATAHKTVRNHHDAEDVCQEVFLQASSLIEHPERLRAKLGPWLLGATRIKCLETLRRRRQWNLMSNEDGYARDLPEPPKKVETRFNGHLQACVDALPHRKREILEKRVHDGQSYNAIADDLGISVGTARQQYFRTVTRLAGDLVRVDPKNSD